MTTFDKLTKLHKIILDGDLSEAERLCNEVMGDVHSATTSTSSHCSWQELAARVMDSLAASLDRTNSEYPEHVKCYPSWEKKPMHLRWLAEMFRTGKPVGNGAGQADVLFALSALSEVGSPVVVPATVLGEDDFDTLENTYGFTGDFEEITRIIESMTLDKVRELMAEASASYQNK